MIGAATMLIPRLVLAFIILMIGWFFAKIGTIGHDDRYPMAPCRRKLAFWVIRPIAILLSWFVFFSYQTTAKVSKYDVKNYKEYLDSDDDEEVKQPDIL